MTEIDICEICKDSLANKRSFIEIKVPTLHVGLLRDLPGDIDFDGIKIKSICSSCLKRLIVGIRVAIGQEVVDD